MSWHSSFKSIGLCVRVTMCHRRLTFAFWWSDKLLYFIQLNCSASTGQPGLRFATLSLFLIFLINRVQNCNWLIANVTKNWVLMTKILKLITSRQLIFCPLSIWNSKVKGLSLKRKHKAPVEIVIKQSDDFTIAIFSQCHIVSSASPNTDMVGENVT